VLKVFANTLEYLRSANSVKKGYTKRLTAYKGRVEKIIKEVRNTGTNLTLERLVRLHPIDIKTFLFIVVSYTPLSI
jgi:hypothetical protein